MTTSSPDPTLSADVLSLSAVSVAFGGLLALGGIDLDVVQGERLAVADHLTRNLAISEPGSSQGTRRRYLGNPVVRYGDGQVITTAAAAETGDVLDAAVGAHAACLPGDLIVR